MPLVCQGDQEPLDLHEARYNIYITESQRMEIFLLNLPGFLLLSILMLGIGISESSFLPMQWANSSLLTPIQILFHILGRNVSQYEEASATFSRLLSIQQHSQSAYPALLHKSSLRLDTATFPSPDLPAPLTPVISMDGQCSIFNHQYLEKALLTAKNYLPLLL